MQLDILRLHASMVQKQLTFHLVQAASGSYVFVRTMIYECLMNMLIKQVKFITYLLPYPLKRQ